MPLGYLMVGRSPYLAKYLPFLLVLMLYPEDRVQLHQNRCLFRRDSAMPQFFDFLATVQWQKQKNLPTIYSTNHAILPAPPVAVLDLPHFLFALAAVLL